MSRESKLNGVAHNIMDHAVSSLGFLTPHVVDFFAASGQATLRFSLLSSEPVSEYETLPQPLKMASEACRQKFLDILLGAGFQPSEVVSAHLEFKSLGEGAYSCECALKSARGRVYAAAMNSKTYWQNKRENPLDALRKLQHGG